MNGDEISLILLAYGTIVMGIYVGIRIIVDFIKEYM